MRFIIKQNTENILALTRRLGYSPRPISGEEFNCIRLLGRSAYPRFHLYIKEDKENDKFFFNLHLDQKKPSYSGTASHGGEYEGSVVEQEAERIQSILQ